MSEGFDGSDIAVLALLEQAGEAARQGDHPQATALVERAVALSEGQPSHTTQVAATITRARILVAQRDSDGVLELLRQANAAADEEGGVEFREAVLLGTAQLAAEVGERNVALRWYEQLLAMPEPDATAAEAYTATMRGRALALRGIADILDARGDRAGAARRFDEAARQIVAREAWDELASLVAATIGYRDGSRRTPLMAQVIWLAIHGEGRMDDAFDLARQLFDQVGSDAPAAVPLAAFATIVFDPNAESTDREGTEALAAAAADLRARTGRAHGLTDPTRWLAAERLNDFSKLYPRLRRELEELIPDEARLFDPSQVPGAGSRRGRGGVFGRLRSLFSRP